MDKSAALTRIGVVVGGSVAKGLTVRLDRLSSLETLSVGSYVTIEGQAARYFGMITDMHLQALDATSLTLPPDLSDAYLRSVLEDTAYYGTLDVLPMLVLPAEGEEPHPVRTVPTHFSSVSLASAVEIAQVFGQEDDRHLAVGKPLDMDVDIVLDLQKLVERSSGVFGKSGTGKTFLTRQLLAGIVRSGAAVNLVFDMHNEYGWQGQREDGPPVKGLKQLFSGRVVVLTLDQESSRRRGVAFDGTVRIGYEEVEPEDIEALAETLALTEAARQAPYRLARQLGRGWLRRFLELDGEGVNELAKELGEQEGMLAGLHRRLDTFRRFPFLVEQGGGGAVPEILHYLDRGSHVVLEFGRFEQNLTAYMLAANFLTRRIHAHYVERSEEALGDVAKRPKPLVITIEEAHKFLDPAVASQTVFGTIARELRKYGVTLLVVDQRPSGIDEEIMSQIGTKLVCLLDNEKDVEAVLSGLSGRTELRQILSRLDSRQQALLLGHAVPVPVVVRTRDYGTPESYAAFGPSTASEAPERWAKLKDDLFN